MSLIVSCCSALRLHTLMEEGLILEYSFVFINETTNDLQGSKKVKPPCHLHCLLFYLLFLLIFFCVSDWPPPIFSLYCPVVSL